MGKAQNINISYRVSVNLEDLEIRKISKEKKLKNIGAYQGEGTPAKKCVFEGGVITGVTMYGY